MGVEGIVVHHTTGRVGWITVDNRDRHNAVTHAMREQLISAADALDADPNVRVVIIRGAGNRAFISGGDIAQFSAMQDSPTVESAARSSGTGMIEALSRLRAPLIAMINGHCLGGGFMIALEADIRIASDNATFGIPAARLGLGYGYEGVRKIAQRVGPAIAAEILLLGQRIPASRALAAGLVNKIVAADELEQTCAELADTIAANAPLTLRAIKVSLREYLDDPAKASSASVDRLVEKCYRSDDFREGVAAFMDKRAPVFLGN